MKKINLIKKIKKRIYILLSYAILSPIINYLVNLKKPRFLVQYLINLYAKTFKVNLNEAEKNIMEYKTVLEFFTRKLKNNSRPISKEKFISPVDGEIIEQGKYNSKTATFKIKNSVYSVKDLVGEKIAPLYQKGGHYISIYLSPKDYHRIHHPANCLLSSLFFIKGRVFPVNHFSTSEIKNVFTKNKRLVAHYQNENLVFTNVMVAALNVGGIKTTFDENYNHKMTKENFKEVNLKATKGEESFVFELGSTVVLLFPKSNKKITFFQKKGKIRMGQKLISF